MFLPLHPGPAAAVCPSDLIAEFRVAGHFLSGNRGLSVAIHFFTANNVIGNVYSEFLLI